jgi:hypothetical protein
MKSNQTDREFVIKAYTRKELRNLYGVSYDVFATWLAPYEELWGLKSLRQFSPNQVAKIVDKYGAPFIRIKAE